MESALGYLYPGLGIYTISPWFLSLFNTACYIFFLFKYTRGYPSNTWIFSWSNAKTISNVLLNGTLLVTMPLVWSAISDLIDNRNSSAREPSASLHMNNFGYTMAETLIEAILWYVLSETIFYALHRLAHAHQGFHKHIHSVHHQHTAPDAWSALYVHPLETLLILYPTILIPLLIVRPSMPLVMILSLMSIRGNIMTHSAGQEGNGFHEMHHAKRKYNYGTLSLGWDKVLGTCFDDTAQGR
jgi:fatty acid hydroxylase domain-containing protein 2